MISLDISFIESQLQYVRNALRHIPGASEKAMMRAINRAVAGGKTDAIEQICTEYAIKPSDVKKTIKVIMAKPGKLEAKIISIGSPLPLMKFRVNPKKPSRSRKVVAGVKFSTKASLPHAFIQKMSNGHVGVFERKAGKGGERVKRLPIKQLYAPSFPQMLGNDEVLKYIEMKAHYRLDKELRHQIAYLLGGGR
jgi:hypothetical protein